MRCQVIDQRKIFEQAVNWYSELIIIAENSGFTREEALRLLMLYQLEAIQAELGAPSDKY